MAITWMFSVCFAENTAGGDVNDKKCTIDEVVEDMVKYHRGIKTLTHLYNAINSVRAGRCTIDSTELMEYLMKILTTEKYRAKDYKGYMYGCAWRVVINTEGLNEELERYTVKKMSKLKKSNIASYYHRAKLLVFLSPNWFRYAMEVYHTEDTTNLHDKNSVYRAVMERFKNGGNPAEMNKVESLLYAVLRKEKRPGLIEVDTYLTKISEKYKNSKQRFEIIKKYDQYYNKKKEETKLSFEVMLGYIDSVKADLSKIKTLTDYTPPLVIE